MQTYTSQNHPGKVFRRRQPGETTQPDDLCNSQSNSDDLGWCRLGFSYDIKEEDTDLWVYTEVEPKPTDQKIKDLLERIDAMIDANKELLNSAEERQASLLSMRDDLLKLQDK
jgi:hypothetical protein